MLLLSAYHQGNSIKVNASWLFVWNRMQMESSELNTKNKSIGLLISYQFVLSEVFAIKVELKQKKNVDKGF